MAAMDRWFVPVALIGDTRRRIAVPERRGDIDAASYRIRRFIAACGPLVPDSP
jgi:hypothetical protein